MSLSHWGRSLALARSRLVENILILSGLHVFTYLFPLITIPFLSRTLGPHGWGVLAFYQAFGAIAIQIVEYGFDWSATRELARERDSVDRRGEILVNVTMAKIALASIVGLAAIVAFLLLPPLQRQPALVPAALFWAFGQACNLNWYFQGLERMRFMAFLALSTKALATAAIFIIVDSSADAWMVLAVNGVAAWSVAIVGFAVAARKTRLHPSLSGARHRLIQGWTFFVFQSAASIYTMGNAFILGLFAAPRVVGFYAAAEKLIRLITSFINPVARALYPRIGHLVMTSQQEASRLVRRSTIAAAAVSVVVSIATWVAAPTIISVGLGAGYEDAVQLLRIMSLLPVAIVPGYLLGSQWMLPLGHERPYVRIVLAAGVADLTLALALAPTLGAPGVAATVVITESFVAASVYLWLRRRSLDPLSPSMRPVQVPG